MKNPTPALLVLAALALSPSAQAASCWETKSLATTGKSVSDLKALDEAMKSFVKRHAIPAANLTVRYKGTVVLERGYGWRDAACKTKMPYDGLFRVASLTKPVTGAMIRTLYAAGKLRPTDKAFCIGGNAPCILTVPGLKPKDARMAQITVEHLLQHSAGWNADISGNPTDDVRGIAEALKVPSPPGKLDVIRHHLSTRALDYAPGTDAMYSNFGFVVLGAIIERASGTSYQAFLQQALLKPLGVSAADMKIAGTLLKDTDPREPFYSTPHDTGLFRSVYDSGPQEVPLAYGQFHIESGGGAGALLSSTRAYTRFLRDYWISGEAKWPDPCDCGFLYFGSIPGSFAMAYQPNRDVDIAAFFDQRDDLKDGGDYGAIYEAMETAVFKVKKWPTKPPSGHLP